MSSRSFRPEAHKAINPQSWWLRDGTFGSWTERMKTSAETEVRNVWSKNKFHDVCLHYVALICSNKFPLHVKLGEQIARDMFTCNWYLSRETPRQSFHHSISRLEKGALRSWASLIPPSRTENCYLCRACFYYFIICAFVAIFMLRETREERGRGRGGSNKVHLRQINVCFFPSQAESFSRV